MAFNSALQQAFALFQPKEQLISPVPESETLDDPGKLWYVAQNQAREEAARSLGPSKPLNKTLAYPEWMANAPSVQPKQTSALQQAKAMKQKTGKVLGASTEQLPQEHINFLNQYIFPITRSMRIPDAVAATQWAVESGRKMQSPINNFFGIGPNIRYDSPQKNVQDYGLTVLNILRAKGYDITKMTPQQIVNALQEGNKPRYEGHNSDPNVYVQTLMNTPEWRYFNR